ncbi:Leucine-rich repeat-containing protein [Plasmodiophora brassicae]
MTAQEPEGRAGGHHRLQLAGRGITSVDAAANMVGDADVVELDLGKNSISRVDPFPVEFGHTLEVLHLFDNGISSLAGSPFALLSRLRVLDLSYNAISNIHGLEGSVHLQELNLSNNVIRDIDNLSSLRHLRVLNLANNEIESISDLTKNENLEVLDLTANFISSLQDASDLLPRASLRWLSLSSNALASLQSFTFLSGLDELRSLSCDDNPFIITAYRDGYSYRAFICFVLPFIETIDERPPSQNELSQSRVLFCEGPSLELSLDLLNLLNGGYEDELTRYLRSVAPVENTDKKDAGRVCTILQPGSDNLDVRSSSQFVFADGPASGDDDVDNMLSECLANLRLTSARLSAGLPDVQKLSSSTRWTVRGVAATVIQSHWRRRRLRVVFRSCMERVKALRNVQQTTCEVQTVEHEDASVPPPSTQPSELESRVATLEKALANALASLQLLSKRVGTCESALHLGSVTQY